MIDQLAKEFAIKTAQVEETIKLIDEGNTIPFIARYRKEVTGNLSDEILRELDQRLTYLRKLEKRKLEILKTIRDQEKLTPQLAGLIEEAISLQEVEDLYLPFKKKKTTRASIAKDKGLEPLAAAIFQQEKSLDQVEAMAEDFINPELSINSTEDARQLARDIIAEWISDDARYRGEIRKMTLESGKISSRLIKGQESPELLMYYEYDEAISKIKDHRILALNRGEKRKVLSVKVGAPIEIILAYLKKEIIKSPSNRELQTALEDSYHRLIGPAIEREIRTLLKERAEASSIRLFAMNLKKLLLQPPFKDKIVMGFDPAFRTGCKLAVLDRYGKVLATKTIYPVFGRGQSEKARQEIISLIEKYQVEIIAIGNGTASRESEQFVAEVIRERKKPLSYIVVNEAGASVYSASELGTAEYPDIDVSIRGAISIGGRLQDPLSELVKIDPKHIGVGQYQHDVNQKELERVLEATVEDAVNNVGVNVNRASASLLSYVAGINKTTAKNILEYREAQGSFKNRQQLKKVKGLGAKTFEQCAGFLRIENGDNILDNTGVHPESYGPVDQLLKVCKIDKESLAEQRTEWLNNFSYSQMSKELGIGIPTLYDIVKELKKPGRDPREAAPKPHLRSDVLSMKDLSVGMELVGTVRNVIDFGAFVDIGVHQDGLVHLSQLTDRYIKHPSEVVSLGDIVRVRVISLDLDRNRIGLSMVL